MTAKKQKHARARKAQNNGKYNNGATYDSDFVPFGAQYYRAPTPRPDQWERDLRNFRRHGFNTIKFWAQWRWNNPREGVFDFSDLKKLMNLAERNKLRVIINIIYDCAPAWFWSKYPESAMLLNNGMPLSPRAAGFRQIGGIPGPSYHFREGIRQRLLFTEAVTQALGEHPALLAWDVWNEPELTTFMAREPLLEQLTDYSSAALEAFVIRLEHKYGTLDNLNESWGRNYQTWKEVEAPRFRGGSFNDMIDWRMFFVDTMVNELHMRIDSVRKHDTKTPIMIHTVPMPYFNAVSCASDEYRLAAQCDWFGASLTSHPAAASIAVSAAPGKRVIDAENHALLGDTYNRPDTPSYEEMKKRIFDPMARGVKGFLFWQYRPEILGMESPAWGLTDLEGKPTEWLEHAVRINHAVQKYSATINGVTTLPAQIAVVNGTKNQIFNWVASGETDRHSDSIYGTFMALHRNQLNADIVTTDYLLEQDIGRYKVIYYPFPYYMEDAVAEKLKNFVRKGGTLISEAFFAGVAESTGLHSSRVPGLGFDKVFGVREGHVATANPDMAKEDIPPESIAIQPVVDLPYICPKSVAFGCFFSEELLAGKADTLAQFDDGRVAVTRSSYGKGQAIMAGTLLGCAYGKYESVETGNLIASLAALGGARPYVTTDQPGVRADLLTSTNGEAMLVVSSELEKACSVKLGLCVNIPGKNRLRNVITNEETAIDIDCGQAVCTVEIAVKGCDLFILDCH